MLSNEEMEALQRFRCRDAITLRPSDRATLLAYIRREWGSEDSFDSFVRSEVLQILASSKLLHAQQVGLLICEHIDLAFGG